MSWTSTNSLHLNATKTKSILITRKKHRPILNFVIGSYPIPQSHLLKFLGVVITDNLSWSSHIESTCLKAKKELRLIHRHYHQAPRVARERLYKLRFSHTLTTVQVFGIPTKQSTRRNWTLYRLSPQKLFCRAGQLGNKDSQCWNCHALKTDVKYKN